MSEYINSWRDSSVAFEQQLDRNLQELKGEPPPHWIHFINHVKNNRPQRIVDIGCGSGRVVYFFSRKNPELNIDGYEIDKKIYSEANHIFVKNRKVKIYNRNVLKYSIKTNYDLYFLADPFKKLYFYNDFFKKILKRKKKFYIVIVNNNKSIKSIKKLNLIDYYYINKSGYKIYSN